MAKEAYGTIRNDPDMYLSIYIPTIVDGSSGVVGWTVGYFYLLKASMDSFACL
jgi:hypothetical protein